MSELNEKMNNSLENSTNSEVKFIEISPDCDIEETKDSFIVNVDMPGLNQDDFKVELDRDMLLVEGKAEIEGLEPRLYRRQFRVMKGLDAAKVQADYKFGVLTLCLVKPTVQTAKQITIQCG